MTLSRLEIDWVVLFGGCKKVLFMVKLLQSMRISVKHLVMIRVDNVRAIFMEDNVSAIVKDIDIRNKYINENVEYGIVNLVFAT